MIYKGNRGFSEFIRSIKENHFYGNNKRILKILTDDDLKNIVLPLTYLQRKLSHEHDELILQLITNITEETEEFYQKNNVKNYLEANSLIDQKLLQIAKLRMVILPEFLINKTIHPVTNYTYAVLRAMWLDNDFRKVKKFSISLGNIDLLDINITSSNQISKRLIENEEISEIIDAKKNLNEKLLDLYRSEYP
jgi:hypothetical protein